VLNDLKEGKVTLPLIFALESQNAHHATDAGSNGHAHSTNGNGEGRKLVSKVLEERDFRTVRPDQITKLVQETGALERSAKLAREYVQNAKSCLDALPDTQYRRALYAIPDFILEREN
jgi:octaprenyl-diphosphate synthase